MSDLRGSEVDALTIPQTDPKVAGVPLATLKSIHIEFYLFKFLVLNFIFF